MCMSASTLRFINQSKWKEPIHLLKIASEVLYLVPHDGPRYMFLTSQFHTNYNTIIVSCFQPLIFTEPTLNFMSFIMLISYCSSTTVIFTLIALAMRASNNAAAQSAWRPCDLSRNQFESIDELNLFFLLFPFIFSSRLTISYFQVRFLSCSELGSPSGPADLTRFLSTTNTNCSLLVVPRSLEPPAWWCCGRYVSRFLGMGRELKTAARRNSSTVCEVMPKVKRMNNKKTQSITDSYSWIYPSATFQ